MSNQVKVVLDKSPTGDDQEVKGRAYSRQRLHSFSSQATPRFGNIVDTCAKTSSRIGKTTSQLLYICANAAGETYMIHDSRFQANANAVSSHVLARKANV